MPQVALTIDQKVEYSKRAFTNRVRTLMHDKRITQERAAHELGMTQGGFSYALNSASFNVEQLMRLFDLLEMESKNAGALITL